MGDNMSCCTSSSHSTLKQTNLSEAFFIQHVNGTNTEKADNVQVRTLMDQRRIVFVSVHGLYESWSKVPSVLMYHSICLMRLKRKWIMEPVKYMEELQSRLPTNLRGFSQFVELLQWKDSQSLVVWVMDYFDDCGNSIELEDISKVENVLVASFWHGLNDTLHNLYDPITESHYNPIILDDAWWGNKNKYISKYGVKASQVLIELFFAKWRHKSIKEIMYQSNPKTLHAVIVYNNTKKQCFVPIRTNIKMKCDANSLETPLSPIKERLSAEVDDEDYEFSYRLCVKQIGNLKKITE